MSESSVETLENTLDRKIDRNPKIFLETRKGHLVSHLTSRSICIILSSPVYIPEVSVVTRQES